MNEMISVVSSFVSAEISSAVAGAMYVFLSLGLMTIAKRRGIEKPWFAWIPVVNSLLLGRIADDYDEKVAGEKNDYGKKCMISEIAASAAACIFATVAVVFAIFAVVLEDRGYSIIFAVMIIIGFLMMMVPVVFCAVYEFKALYRVFKSCDKENYVTYFVLSLIFGIGGIFAFVCRNKDEGYIIPAEEPVIVEETAEEN